MAVQDAFRNAGCRQPFQATATRQMSSVPTVEPAHLDFLTIFSPALGVDEATQRDQILFYYSAESQKGRSTSSEQHDAHEKENERLRQIGLAQGLVEFARGFSNGQPVDSIETDKHRIVLSELERGWWILASINLTVLPLHRANSSIAPPAAPVQAVEYSSREVSPPTLLVQQLVCAYRVFLLHHSPTLGELYGKLPRHRFCALLETYWKQFVLDWDVLLHGNPAVDIYAGVKLAAGGELGMGVGEEDWGSGEREVLEGLVEHTEGLQDLVVMRFDQLHTNEAPTSSPSTAWLGARKYAGPADGIIFSGTGSLSQKALMSVYEWACSIYFSGEKAYGVKTSPTSSRRTRQRKGVEEPENDNCSEGSSQKILGYAREDTESITSSSIYQDVPGPILSAVENSSEEATSRAEISNINAQKSAETPEQYDTMMKYLTLGYGTLWGGSSSKAKPSTDLQKTQEAAISLSPNSNDPGNRKIASDDTKRASSPNPDDGHYLIGLKGNLNTATTRECNDNDEAGEEWNTRLVLRTVYMELAQTKPVRAIGDDSDSSSTMSDETLSPSQKKYAVKRLRVVVYAHRPFLFVLLVDPESSSFSMPSSFHTLHQHLAPLHRPLIVSTSPDMVARRLKSALPHQPPPPPDGAIYDLIYDSRKLTVHTSIPNIPLPGTLAAEGFSSTSPAASSDQSWTRIEALNVHAQILATYTETRKRAALTEKERTVKTGRGWWVLWMQMGAHRDEDDGSWMEAFLIRRANDTGLRSTKESVASARQVSSGYGFGRFIGMGSGGSSVESGPIRQSSSALSEGIGVDAKRYVESLLSLNR